jgi:hypothetical protein
MARFCAKCGFNFDEVAPAAQVPAPAPVAAPEPVVVAPPARKAKTLGKLNRSGDPAGWYPDPLDAGRERQFDGFDWTDEFRTKTSAAAAATPKKRVLLEGLTYGEGFEQGATCYNCGNGLAGNATCPLCGRDA